MLTDYTRSLKGIRTNNEHTIWGKWEKTHKNQETLLPASMKNNTSIQYNWKVLLKVPWYLWSEYHSTYCKEHSRNDTMGPWLATALSSHIHTGKNSCLFQFEAILSSQFLLLDKIRNVQRLATRWMLSVYPAPQNPELKALSMCYTNVECAHCLTCDLSSGLENKVTENFGSWKDSEILLKLMYKTWKSLSSNNCFCFWHCLIFRSNWLASLVTCVLCEKIFE